MMLTLLQNKVAGKLKRVFLSDNRKIRNSSYVDEIPRSIARFAVRVVTVVSCSVEE